MKILKKILSIVMLMSLVIPMPTQAVSKKSIEYGKTYYLDSMIGKTDGDGLSEKNAFDSLDDVNNHIFQPGDKLLIKAGSKFTGTLWPKGSGCEGYPIVIDMYGVGNKPVIDANGAYFMPQEKNWQGAFTGTDGNQIGAAVYLFNQEYIEINNLAVRNQGDNVNRDRSGIRVEGFNYGKINHIYIRNCDISDVRGFNGQDDVYSVIPIDEQGKPLFGYDENGKNPNTTNTFWGARTTHRTGGINICSYTARLAETKNAYNVPVQELDRTKKITTFNDVVIENNTIENCQANGITTTNVKGELDDEKYRHTNVVIRGNSIKNVTRAGIVPLYTSGALVEYNKVDGFQSTTEGYGCGIWCDRANDMIFQYNEVCNGQNGMDGMAFNLDDMTRNGLVQYNYTHDNYGGGYMLHVRQNSYNKNNVIRYNVSINDSGVFANHNAQIVAVGENQTTKIRNAKVYNNTFISSKKCHAVFKGDEVYYNNNIWYFTDPSMANQSNCFEPGVNSIFENNAYIGCVLPNDKNAKKDNPEFFGGKNLFGLNKSEALRAVSLKATSPYIQQGVQIVDNGNQDILARPLTDKVNLGAIQGRGHIDDQEIDSITIDANHDKVQKVLADGSVQKEIINETANEAKQKWVNTTFDGTASSPSVIYTKKAGNYISFTFFGTGGKIVLKSGAGAGKVKVAFYRKNQMSKPIKEEIINTYSPQPKLVEYNQFENLSKENEEYVVRIYNAEETKATNFVTFSSTVANVTSQNNGCKNDQITGVKLITPLECVLPYGKDSTTISLDAKVFVDTCSKLNEKPTLNYSVDHNGKVVGNNLSVNAEGTYQIRVTASYLGHSVSDTKTLVVRRGKEPQVNAVTVDFSKLNALINGCNAIDWEYYEKTEKSEFDKILQEAIVLNNNHDNVTQEQVNLMVKKLKNAKQTLVQKRFDAEDKRVEKIGNWVLLTDSTLHRGQALKSGIKDEKLCFEFTGDKVSVYGRKAVGIGIMKFVVTDMTNNKVVVSEEVDGYKETKEDRALLFAWKTNENKKYRLEVINTGKKHANAINPAINVIVDYFEIGQKHTIVIQKDVLKSKIEEANKITKNDLAKVKSETASTFEAALTIAKNTYKDDKVSQEKINEAYEKLSVALENVKDELGYNIKNVKSALDFILKTSTTSGIIDLNQTALNITKVNGYSVEVCADYEQVIDKNGKIYRPLTDQTIKYIYKVSDKNSKCESKEFTVKVKGIYNTSGYNTKPKVIPELAQWHGEQGDFIVTKDTRIVYDDEKFAQAAYELKNDLKIMQGLDQLLKQRKVEQAISSLQKQM